MFNTFKTKFKNLFSVDIRSSEPGKMFGFSLDEWRYLGYTEIHYVDDDGNKKQTSYILFFVEKNNEKEGKRMYVHCGPLAEFMKDHKFVLLTAEPWASGEYHLAHPILHSPSGWLIEQMEEIGYSWDDEKRFIQSSSAKYNKALKDQTAKLKEEESEEENSITNNVIELKFPKE